MGGELHRGESIIEVRTPVPRPTDARAAYYPGLDGLRAIAVALVIAYHVGVPHMSGGLLGVGVFFTLSGYLITSLLISSWQLKGSLGLKTFWIRRARRLLPAVVLLLVVVMIAVALLTPDKLGERTREALAALFYVANWRTILEGDTYFNRFEGPSPLEHLWSLSVEEQFYVLWPLLLLGLLTVFKGRFKQVAGVTFALGLVSMILLAVVAPTGNADATRAYEGTDTRAGGLLWGAALAFLWHPSVAERFASAAHRAGVALIGALGLVGIGLLAAFTTETSPFIYRGGIALLTIATCMVLFAAAHPNNVIAKVLSVQPLRWLGERTYGIYLWHMPVAAFLPERSFYGNTLLRGTIVVVLTLVIASLSWVVVEDPIRRYGLVGAWKRGTAPMRAGASRRVLPPFIVGGGALTALSVGAMAAVGNLPQMSVKEIAAKQNADSEKKAAAAPAVAYPQPGKPLKTSCEKVVHIGDSSSLGLEDGASTNITDPAKRIRARYQGVGVTTVLEDIKGGRNIIEHFGSDTNGKEAVAQHVREGFDGCWVIALGMNDAATMAKGESPFTADMRVDALLKQIPKNAKVLWVTSVTQAWVNNPLYANKNMAAFNEKVVAATKRYPNLRVYDWASEALPHPEWFLQDDANHNNGTGSSAKARGISRALAVAYPKGGDPLDVSTVYADKPKAAAAK